ncbi:hypothetical protein OV079_40915 [Nannocystis pusilla]|uniref:Uncharacterized protein n=1 Tax=Nannocystis pusilla TaxID=889268 RepID=A0A9X3EX63_9BACT|nr:hypothetical protein [Nannocystis pusilla]MCY1011812.1 hypothetical protein [Nannocystis pusilla]
MLVVSSPVVSVVGPTSLVEVVLVVVSVALASVVAVEVVVEVEVVGASVSPVDGAAVVPVVGSVELAASLPVELPPSSPPQAPANSRDIASIVARVQVMAKNLRGEVNPVLAAGRHGVRMREDGCAGPHARGRARARGCGGGVPPGA